MMPAETDDQIVDVSLKHVVLAFGTVVCDALVVGTTNVVLRDYFRFKRQKSLFDSFTNFIQTLNFMGERK